MNRIYILLIVLLTSYGFFNAQAQTEGDTTAQVSAMATAVSFYQDVLGVNAAIYYGSEYPQPRYPVANGTPYFGNGEDERGDIMYGGMLYKNIFMWYDIVNDAVVVQHLNFNSKVTLHGNRIEYFDLLGRHFIPAKPDMPKELISSVFYSQLYNGKTVLLARYTKKMFENIRERRFVTTFSKLQNEYYLQKDGKYYPVKNPASLLKLLTDKKKQLQQYIKNEQISFKSAPEQAMVDILAYYDSISL